MATTPESFVDALNSAFGKRHGMIGDGGARRVQEPRRQFMNKPGPA